MTIYGLIILDNFGRPIIQSGFRSTSPGYGLANVDALNNELQKAKQVGDVSPVVYVHPFKAGSLPCACCHLEHGGLRFLCPVSGNTDPLVAFAFLRTFIEILEEYFGSVNVNTLKDNFDVVYQLLEETLDSGGHPSTTSTNALRDIVMPPSLLSKILTATGAQNLTKSINSALSGSITGGAPTPGGGPFSSPIPWRKAGLKYSDNRIYFDIVETLKAVVNKNGTPVNSFVWGKIEASCKLSGTPDLTMTFTNPHVLADCAFHPSVRLPRWTRDKALSFVPPDGKFVLLDYRYSPNSTATSSKINDSVSIPNMLAKDSVPLPVTIRSSVELGKNGVTFEFVLIQRLPNKSLENIVIEMYLGEGASALKCTTSRASGFGNSGESSSKSSGHSWSYEPNRQMLKWEIANAPPSSSWTVRGSFVTQSLPRPSHALQIRFDIPAHTFSALKVEQLKLTSETYVPTKGVRGRSNADIEWRW